ncbi:hypothetical protein MSG28_004430 [Choristoneura fumiferana]|uniref:Uncharacterized protein n=1 Tax=Choristoneura fumiferana TaxID=7141 RepID=A0ACC0K633_CHOFU|nr:hypothetical protein MSG28_004430 [Choristoneura fumiferana]
MCVADSKGLIGRFLTEAGKVVQAKLDVDKYAVKDAAVVVQQAADANLPILDLGPLPQYHNRRLQQAATEPLLEDAVVIDETERSNPQLRLVLRARSHFSPELFQLRPGEPSLATWGARGAGAWVSGAASLHVVVLGCGLLDFVSDFVGTHDIVLLNSSLIFQ